jgi:hypothetical protein
VVVSVGVDCIGIVGVGRGAASGHHRTKKQQLASHYHLLRGQVNKK